MLLGALTSPLIKSQNHSRLFLLFASLLFASSPFVYAIISFTSISSYRSITTIKAVYRMRCC